MFNQLKVAITEQFDHMKTSDLFMVDVNIDELWDTYLGSFTPGTNPMFKQRTEHDCSTCKHFIRILGSVVCIEPNGELTSIWDVSDVGIYEPNVRAMSKLVKSREIHGIFGTISATVGSKSTVSEFDHLYAEIPEKYVHKNKDLTSVLAKAKSKRDVFERALTEISLGTINEVEDLVKQNLLYRGKEMSTLLADFKKRVTAYKETKYYSWLNYACKSARIRNTVLGQLLLNIESDMGMPKAVGIYEKMVAPENYKRPKALITAKMVASAEAKIKELGYLDSLNRRHATIEDFGVANTLYLHRNIRSEASVFDAIRPEEAASVKNAIDIPIGKFLKEILPTATKLEMKTGVATEGNIVCLTAAQDAAAKSMFSWGNTLGWAYTGNTADSIKRTVKNAGGNVTGVLRFSLRWNVDDDNKDDLDAHCRTIHGSGGRPEHIYYGRMRAMQSAGLLDVDCTHPNGAACENITWQSMHPLEDRKLEFSVENFDARGAQSGFEAELELDGVVHRYKHPQPLTNKQVVDVAVVTCSKGELKLESRMKEEKAVFTQVDAVLLSPNCTPERVIGNKHYFFMLKERRVDEPIRGFFNEFLTPQLSEHRKVLEVLGAKTTISPEGEQLCGLGFSDTKRASAHCRVSGARVYNIKF